ncbi:hypothetical protein BV25DRAFT_786684 [Artomyces pyxidatus]|uniref:Uncharacterized protein n=1 Tax=Artomyces pyxidatus TaxID=48021 RepID=A0ACB8SXU7_9AGAM|nr:hypothetical protein BV25DRAFT_786684 [Artomyces pyxidatus]
MLRAPAPAIERPCACPFGFTLAAARARRARIAGKPNARARRWEGRAAHRHAGRLRKRKGQGLKPGLQGRSRDRARRRHCLVWRAATASTPQRTKSRAARGCVRRSLSFPFLSFLQAHPHDEPHPPEAAGPGARAHAQGERCLSGAASDSTGGAGAPAHGAGLRPQGPRASPRRRAPPRDAAAAHRRGPRARHARLGRCAPAPSPAPHAR